MPRKYVHKEDDEWRARYIRHLNSSEWYDLKKKVMERSGGACEGCRDYLIEEIHHLTYEHMGHEFLWELVGVCGKCHGRYHNR